MPTYSYQCQDCGHEFDHFQSISSDVLTDCPSCKKSALKRLIGGGAGIIFKGSGFYCTDYRSKNYQAGAEADCKESVPIPDKSSSGPIKPESE